MPELPEVETVRRVLSQLVIKKKISDIIINYSGIIREIDSQIFKDTLINREITAISRYAKYLLIELDQQVLVSHLRMEGKYNYVEKTPAAYSKHDHIIFRFTDGSELIYNDVRKFGTMELTSKSEVMALKGLAKLGVEANDDKLFTFDYLKTKLQTKHKTIKETLLDQTVVAGLGNIYVDEVLFLSKIHPLTSACHVTNSQIEAIVDNSILVLNKAITAGGTTVKSFAVSGDVSGLFQYSLNVYGRKDEPCPVCGQPISKIKVGGRGTHFCSNCQKNDNSN
ncbi:MAG: DNA-formamidopyrimidine glycosylase [Mycoplasmatales bacterium]